jgi:mitochondrial fission protein ELM1
MNVIKNSVSKVKNNPVMSIAGSLATYYLLKKKMPNSKLTKNPYYLVGMVILGGVATAYATSYVKATTSTPKAV